MKTLALICVILVLVGLGATLFFFQVGESEFAVKTFFGDPRRTIENPGLYFKWPWPVESLYRIDRRVAITSPEEGEFLTMDKKNVLVSFFVAWRVVDPERFLVTVNDRIGAESRIQDIVRSEVGAQLGRFNLSDLVPLVEPDEGSERPEEPGGRSAGNPAPGDLLPALLSKIPEIMEGVSKGVGISLHDEFGIDVVAVRMKRLNFPNQNKQAVFQRMEAERERIARKYRSEGEELAEKVKAEADLEQAKLINQAKQKAEEIRGNADAEATAIYAAAYGRDAEFYEFLRKLEAYELFLRENATIVIPADSPLLEVLREGR